MKFRGFRIFCFIILALPAGFLSICNAQIYRHDEITLEVSENYELLKHSSIFKLMKTSDNNFATLWWTRENLWHIILSTQIHDFKSSNQHKPQIVFDRDGDRVTYVKPFLLGENSYLIYKTASKNPDKSELFYVGLEGKNLIPFENPVSISTMKWPDYEEYNAIESIQSENEKFIALYTLPIYKTDATVLVGKTTKYSIINTNPVGKIMVMGENMVKKWELEFSLPNKELYHITDQTIDNSGNFYTLGKLYKETINAQNKDNAIFDYVVWAFNKNGKEKKEYKIHFENKFISNCQIVISENNELICSGYYSENEISNLIGSYCIKIDLGTSVVSNSGFFPFEEDLVNLFTPKGEFKKNEGLFENFEMTDLIIQEDGGVVLIAEKRYNYTQSTQSTVNPVATVYKYDDLMIINFNTDCTLKSVHGIDKNQSGGPIDYPGIASYVSLVNGEDIYLIYYDTPVNLDEKDPAVLKAKKNKSDVLVAASIKPNEGLKFTVLYEAKSEGLHYDPKQALKLNANELILYGDYAKNYSIAKITIE